MCGYVCKFTDNQNELGSLRALLWLKELSMNPGQILAHSRGNLIQVLSKMNYHGQEQMDRVNHMKSI